MARESTKKSVWWVGSSRADLRILSEEVRSIFGFAIYQAELGGKHVDAKPLKGFGGAGVLEVVAGDKGGTYRAVYAVKFRLAIYVLRVFQKKSKRGSATPQSEIEKINRRLKDAERHYKETYEKKTPQ